MRATDPDHQPASAPVRFTRRTFLIGSLITATATCAVYSNGLEWFSAEIHPTSTSPLQRFALLSINTIQALGTRFPDGQCVIQWQQTGQFIIHPTVADAISDYVDRDGFVFLWFPTDHPG